MEKIITLDAKSGKYDDLYIYIPKKRQIVRIAEGTGDNLHSEDIEKGYVDYIYYEQYEIGVDMPEVDGGQVLLNKPFRDKYRRTANCIQDVLSMAYGDSFMEYMIL